MNKIEEFLDQNWAANTKRLYGFNLRKYFKYLKADPDTYFTTKRDYEVDVKAYWKHLVKGAGARLTRNSEIKVVKSFLSYNNVEISSKTWKSLKTSTEDKKTRPATLDLAPSPQIIRKLLDHADTLSRATVLILSSSGMRPSELIQLLPDDLHLNHDPPYIDIRGAIAKNKTSRYVFISYEAKEALEAWQRERDAWLERACRKMLNILGITKSKDDNRVFPMKIQNIRDKYNTLLQWAEMEDRDNNTSMKYRKYHLYTLRKYFRTYLAPAISGGSDVVHALMGHDEYLDAAYQRYNLEQLGTMYKDAMSSLTIYDRNPEYAKVAEDLKEKDIEIQKIKDQLMDKRLETLEMKERIEKLEKALKMKAKN